LLRLLRGKKGRRNPVHSRAALQKCNGTENKQFSQQKKITGTVALSPTTFPSYSATCLAAISPISNFAAVHSNVLNFLSNVEAVIVICMLDGITFLKFV